MKFTKNQTYIGIAVIILGAYWYLKKDNNKEKVYGDEIGIRNAGGKGKFKWYAVKTADRTKANASIEVGTQGLINGTTNCEVSDFWKEEKEGDWSSFKCKGIESGEYDIPNPSRFQY